MLNERVDARYSAVTVYRRARFGLVPSDVCGGWPVSAEDSGRSSPAGFAFCSLQLAACECEARLASAAGAAIVAHSVKAFADARHGQT